VEVRRLRQKVLDTRARLARLVLSGDSGSAATIAAAMEARDQAENAFAALGANLRWQMRRTASALPMWPQASGLVRRWSLMRART
jgi:hypothetical protein